LDYDRLDRVPDVLSRDPGALNRPFAECLSRVPKPEDWQTPLVRMVDRGKPGAVRMLLEHGADVTAGHPDGRSLLQLARDQGGEVVRDIKHRDSFFTIKAAEKTENLGLGDGVERTGRLVR